MKKISILLIMLTAFSYVNSQTLYSSEFPTSNNLSDWDNLDLTGNNPTNGKWKQYTTTSSMPFPTAANGYAYFYSCTDNGSSYVNDGLAEDGALELKSPFSCSGYSVVFLEFYQSWSFVTSYNARIYVEYSYDKTNWNVLFTDTIYEKSDLVDYSGSTPSRLDVSSQFANQASVYLRFRYKGSFSGIWRIDDVKVYVPSAFDLQVFNISTPTYKPQQSNQEFKFWVRNNGATTITEIKADLFVGSSSQGSYNITGLSIAPLEYKEVTLSSTWNPTPGFYKVNIQTSDLNGGTPDVSTTDNTTNTQNIVIYGTDVTTRVPLYEVFTSSTCGPCNPGNANFHSIVDTADPTSYTAVKFQQDFPGTGDPYCTSETKARRSFYSINSIPRMEIDGGWDGNASSFTSTLHNNAKAIPSIVELSGTYKVDKDAKKVSTSISFKPLIDLPNNGVKLYIAIVEKQTYDNVKSNGETVFHQVVKKMIPDVNGMYLNTISSDAINAGVTTTLDTSFTFNGSYRLPTDGQTANIINLNTEYTVEDFNNLYVVAWVQKTDDKIVLQSYTMKLSGSGGGTTSNLDSVYEEIDIDVITTDNKELTKHKTLLSGTQYSWYISDSSLPSNWHILSVCDNTDCYNYPINETKKFYASGDSNTDIIKVDIQHNKTLGYGWANVLVYNQADSAATAKTTKFALLAKSGSGTGSISRVEDAKNFYFSQADKSIHFTGNAHPSRINIITIDGRELHSQLVSGNSVERLTKDFPSGIYLVEVEFKNGLSQVLKVQF